MKNVDGVLGLVLHAHLPFVRHPKYAFHLEEHWLYQAVVNTYLPLLELLGSWETEGLDYRLTLSVSPSLMEMLLDPLLKLRCAAHLDRLDELGSKEMRRTRGDEVFSHLASYYAGRYHRLHRLYDQIDGDIVGAWAELDRKGRLELIAVPATHAFLPLVSEPRCRQAQIELGVEAFVQNIGRAPRGMWLPECGFTTGLDEELHRAGIEYTFVDTHGVVLAEPTPVYGVYAPLFCPSGVAAFARDPASSVQVWSKTDGYPGHSLYREFYRDIGFDLAEADLAPLIHPDRVRMDTGFKYYCVSGSHVDLADKQPYQPELARERAHRDARHFVRSRVEQARALRAGMPRLPMVVALYDAELFGHWWFEGPDFLDGVVREINCSECSVAMWTAGDYLAEFSTGPVSSPHTSSWGEGGDAYVWFNDTNAWIYDDLHWAEAEMLLLAGRYSEPSGVERRALNQAARELLLAQSSDWPFIMTGHTAVDYACARVQTHLQRFRRLAANLRDGKIDLEWLAEVEAEDNLFGWLDYTWFACKTAGERKQPRLHRAARVD